MTDVLHDTLIDQICEQRPGVVRPVAGKKQNRFRRGIGDFLSRHGCDRDLLQDYGLGPNQRFGFYPDAWEDAGDVFLVYEVTHKNPLTVDRMLAYGGVAELFYQEFNHAWFGFVHIDSVTNTTTIYSEQDMESIYCRESQLGAGNWFLADPAVQFGCGFHRTVQGVDVSMVEDYARNWMEGP